MTDEVIRGTTVLEKGELRWPAPPPAVSPSTTSAPKQKALHAKEIAKLEAQANPFKAKAKQVAWASLGLGGMLALGATTSLDFMSTLTTFALAAVVGYQVVWGVTPALHSPLMSVTNAISGIVAVGGLVLMVR